jgi:hypothetical protein
MLLLNLSVKQGQTLDFARFLEGPLKAFLQETFAKPLPH